MGVGNSQRTNTSTEANRKIRVRHATTLRNAQIFVQTNTVTAASTWTLRKNGADTSIVISVGASSTGVFEDTSNSVSIAAGDDVNWKIITGATGTSITSNTLGLQSDPTSTTKTTSMPVWGYDVTFGTASSTVYGHPTRGAWVTTEVEAQMKIRTAGVMKNFAVFVGSNARTTNSTFKSRVNGADGAFSVTYGSGATGLQEDTSNTDTIASGDNFNWSLTTSTGTGNINTAWIKGEFETSNNKAICAVNHSAFTQNFNSTNYEPVGGLFTLSTTEANFQYKVQNAYKFSDLDVYVSANSIATSATTLKFRINSADSGIGVSIAAGATGLFSDTSNTVNVAATDKINYQTVCPNTSGSITWKSVSIILREGDQTTKSFTVDALLKQTKTKTFSADAILKKVTSKTFTVDGWLKKALTKTFTSDAYLKKTLSKTWTADSILVATKLKTFTLDALLKKSLTKTFSADAFLKKSQTKSFTADAYLKKTFTKGFTSDAVLRKTQTKSFAADAFLKKTQSKSFLADAFVKKTLTKSFSTDALLKKSFSSTFSADALLKKTAAVTFSADAILEAEAPPVTESKQAFGGGETRRRRIYTEIKARELVKLRVTARISLKYLVQVPILGKISGLNSVLRVEGEKPKALRLHGYTRIPAISQISRKERFIVSVPTRSDRIKVKVTAPVDYISQEPLEVLQILDLIDLL